MSDQRVRVVFHAGFHKTGTTSLQSALTAHAAWLAPRIMVETRAISPDFAAAAEAARRYSSDPAAAGLTGLRAALSDWISRLPLGPGQCLSASSEDFAGHMPGNRKVRDYGAAVAIAQTIAEVLRRQFGDALDLTLLYTTRQPQDWLKSIHWQLAKHHAPLPGLQEYVHRYAAAADLCSVVAAIRGALPGIRVADASLEALATRRLGPVEAIYDLVPLDAGLMASLPAKPASNQGPTYDLAETFVALNRAGIPRDRLVRIKRSILALAEQDRTAAP